jgi:hypothetical protein
MFLKTEIELLKTEKQRTAWPLIIEVDLFNIVDMLHKKENNWQPSYKSKWSKRGESNENTLNKNSAIRQPQALFSSYVTTNYAIPENFDFTKALNNCFYLRQDFAWEDLNNLTEIQQTDYEWIIFNILDNRDMEWTAQLKERFKKRLVDKDDPLNKLFEPEEIILVGSNNALVMIKEEDCAMRIAKAQWVNDKTSIEISKVIGRSIRVFYVSHFLGYSLLELWKLKHKANIKLKCYW